MSRCDCCLRDYFSNERAQIKGMKGAEMSVGCVECTLNCGLKDFDFI